MASQTSLILTLILALGSAIVWGVKLWLEQTIRKRVSNVFEKEMESVKSDLRLKEGKIASLQATALGSRAGRQAILDKRRLAAVEEIWASSIRLRPLLLSVTLIRMFDMDVLAARAPKEVKVREMITLMCGGDQKGLLTDHLVEQQRPFVSSTVWAAFTTYRTVLFIAYMKLDMLRTGVENTEKISNPIKAIEMVKAALPHKAAYIDQTGEPSIYWLVEDLAEKLRADLQEFLEGTQSDESDLQNASKIIGLAHQIAYEVTNLNVVANRSA